MAISTLVSYSFVQVLDSENGDTYTLHRLVPTFTRYWLASHNRADKWATKALQSMVKVFPLVEYENWERSAELLSHVQSLVEIKAFSSLPPYEAGVLLTAAATFLRMQAQFPKSNEYVNLALATLKSKFGDDDPATIEALCCLGRYQQDRKKYKEAEETLRSALLWDSACCCLIR
jgi:tetratricopeptide (TPR) repeat protein